MNIKSITTLGLVAAALAVTSVAPAMANNNNAYLNNLAMQMYIQNQSAAVPAYLNPLYNQAYAYPAYSSVYSAPYTSYASSYVRPYAYNNVVAPRYVAHSYGHDHWHR